MKVAILAKGPTLKNYPGPEKYDEVWGLNQLGQRYALDLLFVMDDLKLRLPFYGGEEFPEWLKTYPGRIITSQVYEEWPTAEAFPIEQSAAEFGLPMGVAMYSTVDYMFAYAILKQVDELDLFGVDNLELKAHEMRASTLGWIFAAMRSGIKVNVTQGSFYLLWCAVSTAMENGMYGYVFRPRIENLVPSSKE